MLSRALPCRAPSFGTSSTLLHPQSPLWRTPQQPGSWTGEESSSAQCWLSTNVINSLLPSLHYQQRQRVSNYLQYNLHKCHFATLSTSYFAILCHSNKISQPVGRETHPGDIIINGTGPGFPWAVWEAEEQRGAHSCTEMPSGLCMGSLWIQLSEGSVIQSAKFGRFVNYLLVVNISPVCYPGLCTIWF